MHSLTTWCFPSCKLRQMIHFTNSQWTVIICFPMTGFVLVVFRFRQVTKSWWGERSDCLLHPVCLSGSIEQLSTYLWNVILLMGIKSQEYSFMLKLENDEDFWMPLRGEVSQMSGVRDPLLYLLKSMKKTSCVCVCVWVDKWYRLYCPRCKADKHWFPM